MRFARYIILAGLYLQIGGLIGVQTNLGQAFAQRPASSGQTKNSSQYEDLTLPVQAPAPRLQKGQRIDKLRAIDGLVMKRFARRLGEIGSMTRGTQGQIYTTDTKSGRVFIIPDSDQNGQPEQIRALPYRFDSPSAAMELGEHIYIADKQAIWKISKSRTAFKAPIRLASLENVKSLGRFFLASHPYLGSNSSQNTSEQATDIILGYSSQDGQARLISVNIETGRAELMAEAAGRLEQLVSMAGSKPWLIYRNQNGLHMGTNFIGSAPLGQSLDIHGLALPRTDQLPPNWPKILDNHVFISRGNPVSVTALPSSLGAVLPRGRDIFSGFQNNRTAWGQAGALHIDARGLFIADPFNGDIWRVFPPRQNPNNQPKDSVSRALDNLNAAKIDAETPLKRDPLKSAYDSHFPISKAQDTKAPNRENSETSANTPK